MKLSGKLKVVLFYCLLCLIPAVLTIKGQSDIVVGRVDPGFVDFKGFTLNAESTVKINGKVAGFEKWGNRTYYYGWILDAETRNVVWHLLDDRQVRNRLEDGEMFDIEDFVKLPAGSYEVYYTGGYSNYGNHVKNLGDFFKKIFGSDTKEYRRRYKNDLYITLSTNDGTLIANDGRAFVDQMALNSVASIIRVGDNESGSREFGLSEETTLDIYAIGEGRDNRVFDYAWIYDASTYERVWQMSFRRSDYAGGADKNIMFDDKITLPKGNYIVHYVTDGSHSFDEWNLMPPDDPQFWGITIWAHSTGDSANVVPFSTSEINQPVVEITQVRDGEYIYKGFELNKDMEIRILSFGEGYSVRELADYGWIINAETGEKVWDMHDGRLEYAGGAEKNRMVDDVTRLKKGKYIVYYVTDGSHSYGRWNAAPPLDPEKYGITIWAAEKANRDFIKTFDPDNFKSENVIAQIVRVGDDEYLSKSFKLSKTSKVRIIAVGEGSGGDMYDFGWIENTDNGDIVWEMTYRKTEHAGGASKNRKFDGTIMLADGNYKLYYESDGSHSYRDWNASPPYNKEIYGITLLRAED